MAKKAKAERDRLRKSATDLSDNERKELLDELKRQGTHDGMNLRRFTRSENLRLAQTRKSAEKFVKKIERLKVLRKEKSAELQDAIFKSFVFLNSLGEQKDVKTVFTDFGVDVHRQGGRGGSVLPPNSFSMRLCML